MKKKISILITAMFLTILCFSPQASVKYNSLHTGYATYTGSGYSGGALLLDPIPSNMKITALNPTDMNYRGVKAALAGAYLRVEGPKGKTTVYVTDLYPEGAPGALDLSPNAFREIGDMKDGKIDIKWRIVKAPITGNFTYRIKEGNSPMVGGDPSQKPQISRHENGILQRRKVDQHGENGLQPFRQHQSRDRSA